MSQSNRHYSNDQISVVEDLDPEPGNGRGAGSELRRDLLVGLPLVLAIILFACWQWWVQDYQTGQYRAGQEATGRNDWEAAALYFGNASGYSDANAQAAGAREKIKERDRLYSSLASYSDQGNWIRTLRDIREAIKIQPDYLDLPEREQEALDNIYGGVLSGTVALRTSANPPGLYYRTTGGWTYLKGSDSFSAPRDTPGRGQLIYDAPDRGWRPPDGPFPGPNGDNLRGRHLIYARFAGGDTIEYTRLSLDPSYYTWLLAGSNGVWGVHYRTGESQLSGGEASIVRNAFTNAEMAYQPYNNTIVGYAPLPRKGSTNSVVVDLDQVSSSYLLADWSGQGELGPTDDTVVNLYIAVAGKSAVRHIFTHDGGGLVSAQISPNGRYVLVRTFQARDVSDDERQSIVLIDLEAARAVTSMEPVAMPYTITSTPISPTTDRTRQSWLGAVFVPDGEYAGDVLVTEFTGTQTGLQLIDPTRVGKEGSAVIAEAAIEDRKLKDWVISTDDPATLQVAGYDFTPGITLTNTLNIVMMSRTNVEVLNFVAPSTAYPMQNKSSDYGFMWSSYKYMPNILPSANNVMFQVYSAERSQLGMEVISPTLSYSQGLQHTEINNALVTPSIVLGDGFFAYAYNNSLHLHSYDGKDDLILEQGVQAINGQIRFRSFWTYVR